MKIGLLLFDDVDLLDVGGPYEVFLTASRLAEREGEPAPFEVMTIGMGRAPVKAYGGIGLIPTHTFEDIEQLDVVIIPGAIAIDRVLLNTAVMRSSEWLADRSLVTASVCTGAFVLGKLGLLDGLDWTTHFEDVEALASMIKSDGGVVEPWVDRGDIVTAGGLSSGIAMALHLVDRFAGRRLAIRTAKQLHYQWTPDPAGNQYVVVSLIWVGEAGRSNLHEYERLAAPLIAEHGGRLEITMQPSELSGWDDEPPDEIHLLTFADESGYSMYLSDPRRDALAPLRDAASSRVVTIAGIRRAKFD